MATPNALQYSQLGDLVQTTIRDLGRLRWTDISAPLQFYTALRSLMKKNRVEITSGYGLQWDVNVGLTNAAANVAVGASDNPNIQDTMTQATVDWRASATNYSILGPEVAMNREPSRIVTLVQQRRINALISLAILMEANFWGPPVAFADNVTPWGVNTWIVKNATQGFNGGAPSGYTTIGGLNPTTYPAWNNWTDQYVAVSKDDLVRRMRRAGVFTDFEPPVDGIPTFNTGDEYGFYSNYGVIGPVEEILEGQNDNLGNEAAPKDGMSLFRKVPLRRVPQLEADTTNPVYGIQWGEFKTGILKDWWLRETAVPVYPGQHLMSTQFIDCLYQWLCRNRRRQWVIATGTTYPN